MDRTIGSVVHAEPAGPFLERNIGAELEPRRFSETTAREIECAVRGLLDGAFARATRILELNRSALEIGARRLLDKETLTEPELPAVEVEEEPGAPSAPPPAAGSGEPEP